MEVRRKNFISSVLLGIAAGAAAGVGAYTFVYAQGASYLTDRPEACANCHVMREYYDGWMKSSHRLAAVCNDCHTPAGFLNKYWTKSYNGFWHSYAFTTGRFPDVLQIKLRNHEVTEGSCQKCHADVTEAIAGPHEAGESLSCVRCHASVGHF
jgi:cytochrome c nitrite reductase small subunit